MQIEKKREIAAGGGEGDNPDVSFAGATGTGSRARVVRVEDETTGAGRSGDVGLGSCAHLLSPWTAVPLPRRNLKSLLLQVEPAHGLRRGGGEECEYGDQDLEGLGTIATFHTCQ